jgi:hypothetical protein
MEESLRELSGAEAKIVQQVLAVQVGSERDRIDASRIPRSSYQLIRRKLFTEKWVVPRYLPNPRVLDIRKVIFRIARPYAEEVERRTRAWISDPSTVFAWRGSGNLFGVFFDLSPRASSRDDAPPSGGNLGPGGWALEVELERVPVPVYFDFEGAWSQYAGLPGTISYPQSLRSTHASGTGSAPEVLTENRARLLRDLLELSTQRETDLMRLHPYFLSRSLRYLVRAGYAGYRTFLDPHSIPPCDGRRVSGVALVHGTLKPGAAPEAVFQALVRNCRVFPFLFAANQQELLFASLVQTPPPSGSNLRGRENVLSTLESMMERVEVLREPVDSLEILVNHRYGDLIAP